METHTPDQNLDLPLARYALRRPGLDDSGGRSCKQVEEK